MVNRLGFAKRNLAVYLCSHVFEQEASILYVCKEGGDWQFLCGGKHEYDEVPKVVGLGHLLEMDGSIFDLEELPDEWEAERSSIEGPWQTRKIAK